MEVEASLLLSIFESNDKQTINLIQENLKYVYSSGRHLDFSVLAISVSNKSTSFGIYKYACKTILTVDEVG